MSQDLFAAFGDFGSEDTGSVWREEANSRQGTFKPKDTPQQILAADDVAGWEQEEVPPSKDAFADDDDFGDFEDASAPSNTVVQSIPETPVVSSKKVSSPQPRTGASKPFPPKASPRPNVKPTSPQPKKEQGNIGQHPFAGHMDLLFAADDDDYDAGADELGDLSTNPEAAVAYSKRIIAAQEAARAKSTMEFPDSHTSSDTASKTKSELRHGLDNSRKKSNISPAKDPNVLFDADNLSEADEDEDDDFDDFEAADDSAVKEISSTSPRTSQNNSAMPAIDLLGLDDGPQPTTSNHVVRDRSNTERKEPLVEQQLNIRPPTSSTQPQLDDDVWDDFETAEPSWDPSNSVQVSSSSTISKLQSNPTKPPLQRENVLPPTNVPPPAVLLSLFPSLFADADEALFNAIGKLDMKQKQMLLAHPASHQFLKAYLGQCTVLARVIAGRKLRWKRDQYLSQGMRIGPAAAGGKGGMKLTGVDKTEVAKEDREVLDVLRLWKGQIGKLRTAVTAASSAPAVPKLPPVPEIGEQMPVKTLKAAEGGITSPHPCALCGLKREERVGKVDVEVEDNFGEWWVQEMNMHVSCRDFWDEFEKKLKSR